MDDALGILEHSPFAAIAVASDLQVRGWNAYAVHTTGVAAEHAVGRGLGDVLGHPDGEAGWRAVLASDGATPQTVTTTRADGVAIVLECQHQPHAGGVLLFAHDITARHARTLEYRRKEHLLRAIVHNLEIVVWAAELDGTFNYQEGKALATAGLTQGQFVGMNILELYKGLSGIPLIHAAMRGETGYNANNTHNVHWDHWYLPVRDEDGKIIGVAGVTLDISAAKIREQELQSKLDLIEHQQQVIRALSTPIIEVWDSVLTIPMIGIVDGDRAVGIMDDLLQAVTRTRARFAVLDLTGVESLDTATAGNLLGLVRALRLLGAVGIITGIRPAVASTIVALGVDLSGIPVHADLRSALKHCIARLGASAVADRKR